MQSSLSTAPKITQKVKWERTVSTALQIMVFRLCLFLVNTSLWEHFSITVIPQFLRRWWGREVGGGGRLGSRTPLHLSQIAKCTGSYIKWYSNSFGPPYLPVSHLLIQLQIEFFTFSWLNPRMCNQRRFNLGIGGQTVFGNSCTIILKLQLEVSGES